MTDWKCEHDAELGLRREWSERAQKAEAEIERLRAHIRNLCESNASLHHVREDNERMRAALRRSAYALFQIKRMQPDVVRQFAADEHFAACNVLDDEQKADKP